MDLTTSKQREYIADEREEEDEVKGRKEKSVRLIASAYACRSIRVLRVQTSLRHTTYNKVKGEVRADVIFNLIRHRKRATAASTAQPREILDLQTPSKARPIVLRTQR